MNRSVLSRSIIASLVAWLTAAVMPGADGESASASSVAATPDQVLVGRLLLPPGTGSRGVEIVTTIRQPTGEERRVWVLFDDEGRFSHRFRGDLSAVSVSTGLRAELHRLDADELPADEPTIDVGVIDLRDRLVEHRLVLRPADGAPPGEVRIALIFDSPPVGPQGELPALGSRQFPPIALGDEVAWLLPRDPEPSVYFLVERGVETDKGWRGGRQQLVGPYPSTELPSELRID